MLGTQEERVAIKRVNNKELLVVLGRKVEEEISNLRLASESTFKLYQGKLDILYDIIKLLS